jgi:O-acetylserine/cysteine efflux transporter
MDVHCLSTHYRIMLLKDSLLATLVAVIWGVNFVVIAEGLPGVPPLLFAAIRFAAVAAIGVLLVPRPALPWSVVIRVGIFMSIGQFGLLYTALHLGMPAGIASLVLQSQVIFTALIAMAWLGERPSRRQLTGIVIGFGGLALVAIGRGSSTPLIGLLLTLGAGLSWATGNVISRRAAIPSGLALTVWSAMVVPIPLLAMSLCLDGPVLVLHALAHLPPSAIWSTAYTAVLSSLVGFGTWNSLLARHQAAAVVPFALIVAPVGMLTAWLVRRESPTVAEQVGALLVLLGVAVTIGVVRPRRKRDLDVSADPAPLDAIQHRRDGPAPGRVVRAEFTLGGNTEGASDVLPK